MKIIGPDSLEINEDSQLDKGDYTIELRYDYKNNAHNIDLGFLENFGKFGEIGYIEAQWLVSEQINAHVESVKRELNDSGDIIILGYEIAWTDADLIDLVLPMPEAIIYKIRVLQNPIWLIAVIILFAGIGSAVALSFLPEPQLAKIKKAGQTMGAVIGGLFGGAAEAAGEGAGAGLKAMVMPIGLIIAVGIGAYYVYKQA